MRKAAKLHDTVIGALIVCQADRATPKAEDGGGGGAWR